MDHQLQNLHSTSAAMDRFARVFSNVISPPAVFAALGFIIALIDLPFWPGLAWAALYGTLICLIPLGVVIYFLKTGRVSDLHMRNKDERHIPYVVGVMGATIALALMSEYGESPLLLSLIVCNIMALAILGLVNIYWLISSHSASITLATVFVGFVFGSTAGMMMTPLVGITLFVRLLLKRHTLAQLIAGMFVGAAPVLILANFGYIG